MYCLGKLGRESIALTNCISAAPSIGEYRRPILGSLGLRCFALQALPTNTAIITSTRNVVWLFLSSNFSCCTQSQLICYSGFGSCCFQNIKSHFTIYIYESEKASIFLRHMFIAIDILVRTQIALFRRVSRDPRKESKTKRSLFSSADVVIPYICFPNTMDIHGSEIFFGCSQPTTFEDFQSSARNPVSDSTLSMLDLSTSG